MPTYEYQCLKCKKHFDQIQKMTDAPIKKCIHCGGKVERLIGNGAGIIFKGTGFYSTDYKNKSPHAGKSGEKKEKNDQKPK